MLGIFKRNAPEPAPKRKGTVQKRSGYNAAKIERLMNDWVTGNRSSTADLRTDLPTLRARSRDLFQNNDYIRRFVKMTGENIVGPSGVKFANRSKNPDGKLDRTANQIIEAAFNRWGKKGVCTVDGRLSWRGVQKLVVETVARDGEVLVRMVRGRSAGNDFGFALQVLEVDYLDHDAEGTLPNGNRVDMGVEVDGFGRPVAYYMFTKNPRNDYVGGRSERIRVPAEDILHIFDPERPEQLRGVPWAVSAMFRMRMLGGYEEAEVVAARIAASKMGFYKTQTGDDYVGDDEVDGEIITEAEPGTFEQLPPGVDFQMFDPSHPTSQFRDFVKGVLRGAASGLGVSYNALANDLEGVNYSSLREGSLKERDVWRTLQAWFVEGFCEPIFDAWLPWAFTTGQVGGLPVRKIDKFSAPQWSPRGWAWVDPQKEVSANIEAVNAGFKSKSEVLAEQGRDFEETLDTLVAEREMEQSKGLNDGNRDNEDA